MKIPMEIMPAGCKGLKGYGDIAEEKLDGHRGLVHFGGGLDRMYLTGRNISKVTGRITEKGLNVPHLNDVFARAAKLLSSGYTVLDGEVVLPGRPFEDVQSVMGAKPAKAIARQATTGLVQYRTFDILYRDGVDVRDKPLSERLTILREVLIAAPGFVNFPRRIALGPEEAGLQEFHDGILAEPGGEGTIIKDLGAPYGKGWRKYKKEVTYDVVITGFEDGAGKFKEMIGAVIFGVYKDGELVTIGRCSGMSDGDVRWEEAPGRPGAPNRKGSYIVRENHATQAEGTRAWFTMNRAKLVGTVIEVRCNGLTNHGKLRHPQFHRTKSDKSARQCVMPADQT